MAETLAAGAQFHASRGGATAAHPVSRGAIPMVFILCEWRPLELETWQVSLPVGSQPHLLDRQCLLKPVASFSLRMAREHGTGLMILTPIRKAAQRPEHRCLQVAGESPQAAPTVAPALFAEPLAQQVQGAE